MPGTTPVPAARIKYEGEEYLLFPDRSIRIGRSFENDLVVNDPKVSRNHALVEWDGSGFAIRDLGSSNGTFVNGQAVHEAPHPLHHGDTIVIHQQPLSFEVLHGVGTAPLAGPVGQENELPGSPKGPRLVVRAGPDAGQEYVLWGDRVTIGRSGRDASWEIRLSDRAISRPHATLQHEGETFVLIDLGSANGTIVNGVSIDAPVPLKHGDTILLGGTHLVYYD